MPLDPAPVPSLPALLAALETATPVVPDTAVAGITADSRAVRPGSVFVAVPGTARDGHDFIFAAVAAGAVAVVVERRPDADPGVPVIEVESARRALARLAAAWHGHPARRLSLTGITGTVGKTSVLTLLHAILERAGLHAAAIGSLGARVGASQEDTGHTTPGPLLLQEELRRAVDEGLRRAVMEVTSHALVQERVHGLRFDLGIFTNLLPLEHSEYHPTFRGYANAKLRFFQHFDPGATLIYSCDSPTARGIVAGRDLRLVGCGSDAGAAVRVSSMEATLEGTRLWLSVQRPLERLDGGTLAPVSFELRLRVLGRSNRANATLAAAAGLCLGAEPEHVRDALEAMEPPRRRMELIHRGRFAILDDTVGHPDSVSALFDTVRGLAVHRLHAVFAIRGRRGVRVNEALGEALAIWARQVPLATLVVTGAEDTADERNRVSPDEREAFLRPLRRAAVPFDERATLGESVPAVLEAARDGDLVLLLGAQGMDAGADRARRWLAAAGEAEPAAGAR